MSLCRPLFVFVRKMTRKIGHQMLRKRCRNRGNGEWTHSQPECTREKFEDHWPRKDGMTSWLMPSFSAGWVFNNFRILECSEEWRSREKQGSRKGLEQLLEGILNLGRSCSLGAEAVRASYISLWEYSVRSPQWEILYLLFWGQRE